MLVDLSKAHAETDGAWPPPIPSFRHLLCSEAIFHTAAWVSAFAVFGVVVAFFAVLAHAAWPAFDAFGLNFFTSHAWNPVRDDFGALPAVYGTIVTSTIALLLALPVGFGIAVYLAEMSSRKFGQILRSAIELLAGIPSIVYGFWGLFVLAPLFQDSVQPFLIAHLETLPVIGNLFAGPAYGVGFLTAGSVLAIMILPFLSAFLTDVFKTVSPLLKEAGYAVGSTRWEVIRHIMIPSVWPSVVSGVMLALGRALGETMAVTFVIGNAHRLSTSLLAPGTTLSASIANEFNEATSNLHIASLLALGLILLALSVTMQAASKMIVKVMCRREKP